LDANFSTKTSWGEMGWAPAGGYFIGGECGQGAVLIGCWMGCPMIIYIYIYTGIYNYIYIIIFFYIYISCTFYDFPIYVHIELYYIYTYIITSSTAQGGGGSFKNRKPIGEVGCCESGMAKRIH
jgi:hypothetical protein